MRRDKRPLPRTTRRSSALTAAVPNNRPGAFDRALAILRISTRHRQPCQPQKSVNVRAVLTGKGYRRLPSSSTNSDDETMKMVEDSAFSPSRTSSGLQNRQNSANHHPPWHVGQPPFGVDDRPVGFVAARRKRAEDLTNQGRPVSCEAG